MAGLLAGLAFLYRDPLVNLLYHSRFFHPSSNRVRTVESHLAPLFNLKLSVSDLQFLNTDDPLLSFPLQLWQEVTLETEGRQYHVELSHFENYFSHYPPAAEKPALSIRFSENESWRGNRQVDLFLHREIDVYEQQLLYDLGRTLGLIAPASQVVKAMFDYEDAGLFILKQAYDQVFLERLGIDNAVIFMMVPQENGYLGIRTLFDTASRPGEPSPLSRFLTLMRQEDPNLLYKFFDLEYLAKWEILRRALKAESSLVLATNLRYIYNRDNGKIYPILDESNGFNLKYGSENRRLPFLAELYTQAFVTCGNRHLPLHLSDSDFRKLAQRLRTIHQRISTMLPHPVHRLKMKAVSGFFRHRIQRWLKANNGVSGRNRRKCYRPLPTLSGLKFDRDNVFLSTTAFMDRHPDLNLKIVGQRLVLQEGRYRLRTDLVIPFGIRFEISAGCDLMLDPGVSLICHGRLIVSGTEQKGVRITALDPATPFGSVAVLGEGKSPCRIRFLELIGAGGARTQGLDLNGGLTFLNADAELHGCRIADGRARCALKMKNGRLTLTESAFLGHRGDYLVLDRVRGRIERNRFEPSATQSGADGIKATRSRLIIRGNLLDRFSDKALNLGNRSRVIASDNTIRRSALGVAVKDSSEVILAANTIEANDLSISLYRRDAALGGGHAVLLADHQAAETGRIYTDKDSCLSRLEDHMDALAGLENLPDRDHPEKTLAVVFKSLKEACRIQDNVLEEFSLGGRAAAIDQEEKIVFLRLPSGSSTLQEVRFRCLIPDTVVSLDPDPFERGGRGERPISTLQNGSTVDFEEFVFHGRVHLDYRHQRHSYGLFITDGDLGLVAIDTRNRSGSEKTIQNEPKIPCVLFYFPSPSHDRFKRPIQSFFARIEGRGQKRPKWKYGLTLEKETSLEDMKHAKRWVLESSFSDKSLMRTKIAFDLLEQFRLDKTGRRLAPASEFIEVILNRGYAGIYLLMEHIDKDFIGLEDFDRNEGHNAVLFRATNRNANFTSVNTEPVRDKTYAHFLQQRQPVIKPNDPIQGWHSGFAQRHPDPDRFGEHWEGIEEFSRFVALSQNDQFNAEIFSRLDRSSYIDLWILTQLIDDTDGLYQNRYLARHKGRKAKWIILPWDKDGVLGRDHTMKKRPYDRWLTTHLFSRCLEIPSFREAFAARWRELVRRGVIVRANISAMIEANRRRIAAEVTRNFRRWPVDDPLYPDTMDFSGEIAAMDDWIDARIRRLDKKISSLVK